ncbi:MAG: metal-dependent hydrolase [Planctomycetaceae bacterium]|nr:metal-dependent hydrolase [Planctomycetaceae bacterium]
MLFPSRSIFAILLTILVVPLTDIVYSLRSHQSFVKVGNFRQHVTCSTITGIVLGGVGYYSFGLPLPTCLLSAGLCSIAGMFPDIDSDTSRSFQECIYLAAGIAAVLFVQRLRQLMIEPDLVLFGGGAMLLFVRFGVGELVKKITSHRGMFHSIPSAVFAGQITYFLSTGTPEERIFKAFALSSGYFSHLILDEICSVDSNGRVKKSFGTALKWFDPKKKGTTLILYTMVIGMGITVFNDSEANGLVKQFASDNANTKLTDTINEVKETFKTVIQQEAAAYLVKEKNKEESSSTLPVTEPLPPRISVSNEDHDRHLFSRRQRRSDRVPAIAVGSETAVMTPLQPTLPAVLSKQKSLKQEYSKQEFQYGSAIPPSSPLPKVFETDFRNHGNYRNFALPNREPATVILP